MFKLKKTEKIIHLNNILKYILWNVLLQVRFLILTFYLILIFLVENKTKVNEN